MKTNRYSLIKSLLKGTGLFLAAVIFSLNVSAQDAAITL